MAAEDFGERAFPGAVRPHDGVHFPLGDFKIDAFKNFRALHAGVQIFNDQAHDVKEGINPAV